MSFDEIVKAAIGDVIAQWVVSADDTEPEDLAREFIVVGDAVRQLQAIQTDIEARLVNVCDAPLTVKGLGTFEKRAQAKNHTWDSERLLGVVLATADAERIPDEDGEIVSLSTQIQRILPEVAHIDYWRLQALDRHDIDGRKYRFTEWGRKRIKFTPEQEQPPEGG